MMMMMMMMNEDFIVDKENEIVEPNVDVHLFVINTDLPFDNIGVTNLVPNDVLEGEDVDFINADGFNTGPGNNDETKNYRRIRLAELSREMEAVMNAIVKVNTEIPVKSVQDQLQHNLEVQISMSKAFRAKAKAEREIRGDHVLQYSMLRDYVFELQSINPNTTVKIAIERNTDPSLPTRVFQRIYVCLGALKLAVGLDSNNGIYPLAYALVEAESKSSWCWFLQCLGDDIDMHPNLNFTFISDRQKQGWCGQAYKDLLWRSASAISVKDFEKCMLELKMLNPKAHEWLNKIPPEHWARSYFSGFFNACGGSASRQAQQTEPAVGQDGSGRSGAGAVIGLSLVKVVQVVQVVHVV
ncbi:mutator type transposase [Tanacetum coccineum]